MRGQKTDLLQGTLELLVLRLLHPAPLKEGTELSFKDFAELIVTAGACCAL